IRPRNHSIGDKDKQCVGFGDNTKDFLIVWGAGKEDGQKVNTDSAAGRFFFQVLHLRNMYGKESITLTHTAEPSWEQKVWLSTATNQSDVVRMKLSEMQYGNRHITFEGTKVPLYYPRWFPPRPNEGKRIEYKEIPYPKLSIEFKENDRSVYSPIFIYLHKDGNKEKICNIVGDLMYAWPHLELFALLPEQGIFVVRVWLYWIHKRFIGNYFYGFSASDISEEGKYRKIEQKLVLEIPDIERFDFILDTKLGKITWYGTDFHYQEHWGRIKGDIVEARIAGGFDLVQTTIDRYPDRFKNGDRYDLVEKLKNILSNEQKPESMKFESIPDMSLSNAAERAYEYRAFNIKTHVPYVRNGEIAVDMISNIVS
ncbi:unnamed protein product, partial [marine sediment metagenome]